MVGAWLIVGRGVEDSIRFYFWRGLGRIVMVFWFVRRVVKILNLWFFSGF